MPESTWHIRLQDQVVGPITQAELRELARQGGVQAQTPISCDGATWVPAASVAGIVFGPPPAVVGRSSPPAQAGNTPPFPWGWIIGALVLGGGIVLICGGVLLAILAANVDSESPGSQAAANAPSNAHDDRRSSNPTARLNLRWGNATDELAVLLTQMSPAEKALLGLSALATGVDIFAVRVVLSNTGTLPIRVFPQNIHVRLGNESAQVYTANQPGFLRVTIVQPGQAVSGLVTFIARMDLAAAILTGSGGLSYDDSSIEVTYR